MPALADFDATGLEVECLAQLTRVDSTLLYQAPARGGTSVVLAGELGIGSNDVPITEIARPTASRIRFNDSDPDLTLSEYFGADGGGADLTLWLQTDADVASTPLLSNIVNSGGNFLNSNVTVPMEDLLDALAPGDDFLFALTRAASTAVSAGGAVNFGPLSLDGRIDTFSPVASASGNLVFGPVTLAGGISSQVGHVPVRGSLEFGPATLAGAVDNVVATPGVVTLLRAAHTGFNSLDVAWSEPLNPGLSDITGYQVRVGDFDWENVGVATSFRAGGLRMWETYRVSVRAVNSDGTGAVRSVNAQVRRIGRSVQFPGAVIPVRNLARQQFTVRLSGLECRISLWWQPSDEHWYATVEAPVGTQLVSGRRLVNDVNLLARVQNPLLGSLFIRLLGSEYVPIGREAWGSTHVLRYETG